MNDPLNKGLAGALLAGSLAVGSALHQNAPKPPVEDVQAPVVKPWTSNGLDPEMHPIAHLESSWGKNLKHAAHPGGVFQTAYGAVGLKPQTAHEEYLRSKDLQKEYPNLQKPEDFTAHLMQDHVFYNKTASKHWQHLRTKLGSPVRASYGWRWGIGAARRTPEQIQKEDPYVIKFAEMSHHPIAKMSIEDVAPGKKKKQFVWDYSHLLTPENKMAGYQINVSFHQAEHHPRMGHLRDRFHGEILHNGKPVGNLSAAIHTKCLGGPCIEPHVTIKDGHQKRGLGTALYEGVFKEAKMAGVKSIHGYDHSEAAHSLHSRLAQRHGMGYRPKDKDGDYLYPHGEYKYLIKAEGEHAGTIRQLLSSDKVYDWSAALRIPGANQEDVDFLMDRLATVDPATFNPVDGSERPINALNSIASTPLWNNQTALRAMQVPIFQKPRNIGVFLASADDNDLETQEEMTGRMLNDLDVWAPKAVTENDYEDDGKPIGSVSHRREGLVNIYDNVTTLTPEHFDRIFGLVHDEKLDQSGWNSNFFSTDNLKRHPISPEYISKWMDMAGSQKDGGYLMRHLGRQINGNDALFQKALHTAANPSNESDTARGRDSKALSAYASSGKMSEEHLKHLLAHPASIRPSTNVMTPASVNIMEAITESLYNSKNLSTDAAKAVVRHPNKGFVEQLSDRDNLPPEVYRAIYEAHPEQAIKFVGKTECPEDIRLAVTQKALDEGKDLPHHLTRGFTTSYDPESGEQIEAAMSKEMVDLAVNHANPSMLHGASYSPHLNQEHAEKLINRGYGSTLIPAIDNAYLESISNKEEPNNKIDRDAIVKLIASRPQDVMARSSLAHRGGWRDHLSKEFYDSVANNELSMVSQGKGTFATRDMIYALVSQKNTSAPTDFLKRALAVPAFDAAALYHPNLPQVAFDEHLPLHLTGAGQIDPGMNLRGFLDMAGARHRNIQEKHLDYVKGLLETKHSLREPQAEGQLAKLYASPAWSKETLDHIWSSEDGFYSKRHSNRVQIRNALLNNDNASPELKEDFMVRPDVGDIQADVDATDLRYKMIKHLPKAILKRLAEHFSKDAGGNAGSNPKMAQFAKERLAVFEPDSVYRAPWKPAIDDRTSSDQFRDQQNFHSNVNEYVGPTQGHIQVRPGNQKLRKIRDLIMEKNPEKGEIKPKDLPPGDWSAGRLPNGNISAKKLNEHIDSQEPIEYNYSHAPWSGAQRHSVYSGVGDKREAPQKVFQVNLTNDMFDKLEAAGVGDTFRKMVKMSQSSSHPVRMDHTLGWVRYDGNKQDGFHIDEIQSDFGQSFVRQAAQQAAAGGHDAEEAGRRAESEFPEAHYGIIKNILFKDKHPNEMLAEAFHQFQRDSGNAGSPVHMLHAETKAPISGQDPNRPLPAHMQHTYKEVPKKLGMEPASYGQVPSQNNEKLAGKPTWKGKIRKFELALAEWGVEQGIEELAKAIESGDFKGIARAIDPTGGSTVDHHPHLDAHPSHMTDEVNDYRANVLESPTRNKKLSSKGLDGITRKVVYKTKTPDGKENRYMVKPYHERVVSRVKDWMRHPIQGWAEMCNQGLYHAAGIGDLHQKVHVSEHPMDIGGMGAAQARNQAARRFNAGLPFLHSPGPEKRMEPALVVHLDQGFKPVIDHTFKEHDADLHDSVKKIGVMDFLTNNLDRHGLNLMVDPEKRKVLAVDHSRSFQYKTNSKPYFKWNAPAGQEKMVRPKEGDEDSLANYIKGTAISKVIPAPTSKHGQMVHQGHYDYLANWQDTIENWWPKVSQSLRAELDKHLEQIKNPNLKEHIRRNFHSRADLLDEMADLGVDNYGLDDWHDTEVEMHRYKG